MQQKNALRVNGGGEELALQSRLRLVEHQAARVVAEQIAADPPKALMAVISPQSLGGWSGGKRREFGAEGGGAPCPSEFLLQREKRSNHNDEDNNHSGPSRHHPNATTQNEEEAEKDGKEDAKQSRNENTRIGGA